MDVRKILSNIRVAEHRRKIKNRAILYKGGKCQKCGYDKSESALDFHHRDPTEKEFRIGAGNSLGWEKIQRELDKCDLLCANCHREIHENWRITALEEQREFVEHHKTEKGSSLVHCKQCSNEIRIPNSRLKKQKHCFCSRDCLERFNTKGKWPSDSKLRELVWKTPMIKLAVRFGVSDKAISKRCKTRGIDLPGLAYWN